MCLPSRMHTIDLDSESVVPRLGSELRVGTVEGGPTELCAFETLEVLEVREHTEGGREEGLLSEGAPGEERGEACGELTADTDWKPIDAVLQSAVSCFRQADPIAPRGPSPKRSVPIKYRNC
eukprot:Hpha_TRINITY_DN15408_c0_g2::TRINITY_DN15408_c0_g2_i1::g.174205::m.174205